MLCLCPAPRAGVAVSCEQMVYGADALKRTNLAFICLNEYIDVLAFYREKRMLLADISLSHFFLRPDSSCPGWGLRV